MLEYEGDTVIYKLERTCKVCRKLKDRTEFRLKDAYLGTRGDTCRDCLKAAEKKKRETN